MSPRISRLPAWFSAATHRDIVRGAGGVSLVVGVVLNLINQGESLMSGSGVSTPHVALNFLVPYLVATWSGARAIVRREGVRDGRPHGLVSPAMV